MVFPHIFQNTIQYLLIFFRPQQAIRIGNNAVGPTGVKSCDNPVIFICPHRILRFIAVSERLLHPHNRLYMRIHIFRCKPANPGQAVPDLPVLKFQLLLIRKRLKLAASALPVTGTFRLYAKRRRL